VDFVETFPCGAGKSERAVEIPWVLSRYKGEQRVLEVGCSFASENPEYIQGLLALNIPELHGIDISAVEAPHFIKKTADIRESGYEKDFFDLVLCVSTVEHVGRDNTKYYKPVAEVPGDLGGGAEPDVKAIVEMFRILKRGGRLLVTVPFGKFVDYGWFINYDLERVNEWVRHIAPERVRREYFKYTSPGWIPCCADDLRETACGDNSAPAAAGLACFEIIK
jgi:SAM-dependent methyltransferase